VNLKKQTSDVGFSQIIKLNIICKNKIHDRQVRETHIPRPPPRISWTLLCHLEGVAAYRRLNPVEILRTQKGKTASFEMIFRKKQSNGSS